MTLERIEHKVFASEAPLDEMGQFGSALATTKLNTKDVAEIQALPAYTKGWGSAIISENNYPAMEEMNGVLNVMSYHTGYLYQEGIPTYSATQEYSVTSWVKDLAGEKVYKSLQGGNKGHDLTDPAWWMELKLGGGGLEIGDIGIAPLGIDETKGKRRYLNGQLIIQEQYVEFTNKVKSAVALYPSLACTESEWQTTATMTVGGQVGKFVVDDEGGTIRLPKIIMPIQGLTDLSKLGEIVEAGLPNIEATSSLMQAGGSARPTGAFVTNGDNYAAAANVNVGWVAGIHGFNASRSNPTYGNSDTVQQEQIQYPYFIQVATGAETEDNIINEIELNNPFSLLDYKYSEYELHNLSWLRSEGQYNSKAVYPAVYDLLLKIYNGTEAKAGVSVKLSTGSYTDYDFVLNTSNETFRLPIKVKLASGKAIVGNGIGLGLTNGESNFSITASSVNNLPYFRPSTGYGSNVGDLTDIPSIGDTFITGVTTDPTKSGIETSDSDLYLYFYVGETVQNANLINAGRIEEKLSNYTTHNMVDGQWIRKYKKLSTATAIGNYTLDLSDYLPNDGYAYEINMNIYVSRSDSSGTNTGAFIYNASLGMTGSTGDSEDYFAMAIADGSHMAQEVSSGIAIVTQNRKLNVSIANYSPSVCYVSAVAYRRIGTNV